MDPEGDEPRREDSPYTRGADFTSLTGMSSEFHNLNMEGPGSDPDNGILSGEEADDSDPDGLSTIWAVHGIAKSAICEVLSERVYRHI